MNSPIPDTRDTLISRLPNRQDAEAWEQFITIYQPLVYRLARAKGFQDADAREIVQEVLLAVSQAVERWDPSPELGRFRDWLFRIARNLMINFMTRRKHRSIGSGDSCIADLLDQQPDRTSAESEIFELEYRRELFRLAAEKARERVSPKSWQAFWSTCVAGESVPDVAARLGMTVGAVHIARSRVRAKIRAAVVAWQQEDSCSLPIEGDEHAE